MRNLSEVVIREIENSLTTKELFVHLRLYVRTQSKKLKQAYVLLAAPSTAFHFYKLSRIVIVSAFQKALLSTLTEDSHTCADECI